MSKNSTDTNKTLRLAKTCSQAHADQYVQLGWVLRHEFRAPGDDIPYEYILEWPHDESPAIVPDMTRGNDSNESHVGGNV